MNELDARLYFEELSNRAINKDTHENLLKLNQNINQNQSFLTQQIDNSINKLEDA